MLIEFTVGNYRSFKMPVTFSLLASSLTEYKDTHVFAAHKLNLLKSAIIYGANASGKSSFFKAISFMKNFIFNSAKETQITEKIDVQNFKLSTETENKPALFEIIFLVDQMRYRYGFQVTEEKVTAEWLFHVPTTKEARLFIREQNNIVVGPNFKEGKGLEARTRDNALFLSVAAQFNGEISLKILSWFNKLTIISGLDDRRYMGVTLSMIKDSEFKQWALKFLGIADIEILDIDVEFQETDAEYLENLLKDVQKILRGQKIPKNKIKRIDGFSAKTVHQKYDSKNRKKSYERFEIAENESEGTKKLLALSGPIWDTLKNGKILFIDEFEARLHQKLTLSLVKLFNSSKSNLKDAQFVLATHDTNLLRNDLFRRDQIWFINKDQYGVSDLYSLAEYKESNKITRKDTAYGKNYLAGRYGGIPVINDFEGLFEVEDGK